MKIRLSGIYLIKNIEEDLFYIGLSTDIFSRWSTHYTHLKINKHSSSEFQSLFNRSNLTDWTFSILEVSSETEFRKKSGLKGMALKKAFRDYLVSRERFWMSQYEKSKSLNADNKFFLN